MKYLSKMCSCQFREILFLLFVEMLNAQLISKFSLYSPNLAKAQALGLLGENKRYLFPKNCPNWIYFDEQNEEHYDDFEEFGQFEAGK